MSHKIFSLVFAAVILSFIVYVAIIQGHSAYAVVVFPDFNFGAAGDWGCTSDANSTAKNMIEKGIELNLGLGDYSYDDPRGAKCWLDTIKPIFNKTKISMGNNDNIIEYMNVFNLTKQYYSFDVQNVHFLVISTELQNDFTEPQNDSDNDQLKFVRDDLNKTSSNPDIDWIVVYFHRQAYTSLIKDVLNPGGLDRADNTTRNKYHPLFDKYNVDIVLQAHNHNYERSYPLNYNKVNPDNPIKVSNETNNYYSDLSGPIFVTVGTGGNGHYKFVGKKDYIINQTDSSYGFLNVDVINNGTKLNAKFLSNNGIVEDQFTIVKSP
ncbi:MAG TPA: metallophosphoesterase [Nitrososphaeraceae archaeon]|nr:metallophosphoesterase [Nitrososphaeraceae archaeon]